MKAVRIKHPKETEPQLILKDDKLIIKEQLEMVLINKLPKRYSISI